MNRIRNILGIYFRGLEVEVVVLRGPSKTRVKLAKRSHDVPGKSGPWCVVTDSSRLKSN